MKSKFVAIPVLAFVITFFCASCTIESPTQHKEDVDQVYAGILETGQIRVGYVPYPPSLIKDPNTKLLSGIFHDALELIGKRLNLDVVYTEELTWGTMIEAVASNRVDIVNSGIWPNAARGKLVDFSSPLYYSPIYAYGRLNDDRFDEGLERLNEPSATIAIIDGEMAATIAKQDFPAARKVSLTQSSDVSQMLLELTSGKADAAFVEPAIAEAFIRKNPDSIKQIGNKRVLRAFPNTMLLPKGAVSLKSTLDTAIAEMHNNGDLEQIIRRYEQKEGLFLRNAKTFALD